MTLQGRTLLFCSLALLIGILAANYFVGNVETKGFKDSASILAFITGASVAIERIIEIIWTTVAMFGKSSWPRKKPQEEIERAASDLPEDTKKSFADFIDKSIANI